MLCIDDLPDEILEFILGYLHPYKCLNDCMLVCHRWNNIVKGLKYYINIKFNKALTDTESTLCWKLIDSMSELSSVNISSRFSHNAVIHDNAMYVFGGGSSKSTTVNDLWRFDLSLRKWARLRTFGSYPSPKSCSTMVSYKNSLIVFGGWRQPSTHPPFQQVRVFDELHVYDIKENKWYGLNCITRPPPLTAHSASIIKDTMIIFGGCKYSEMLDNIDSTNDLWCFDLIKHHWYRPNVSDIKPTSRYGHYQFILDDNNLLILGGCSGPNSITNDCWLLNISEDLWKWKPISIKNKKCGPAQMWCFPSCKIGSKLIVLGPASTVRKDFQIVGHRFLSSYTPPPAQPLLNNNHINVQPNRAQQQHQQLHQQQYQQQPQQQSQQQQQDPHMSNFSVETKSLNKLQYEKELKQHEAHEADIRLKKNLYLRSRDDNHYLPRRFDDPPVLNRMDLAAFTGIDPVRTGRRSQLNYRERRLEFLRSVEEKYMPAEQPVKQKSDQISPSPPSYNRNLIGVFICDLSNIFTTNEPSIVWTELENNGVINGAPERLMCSTFVPGNGEIILFGGLLKTESDTDDSSEKIITANKVYTLTLPKKII